MTLPLNTWTQKADFGGTGRNGAVGFSIGSKGYIGTGYDGSAFATKISGSTTLPPIPGHRRPISGGQHEKRRWFLHREQGLHRDRMGWFRYERLLGVRLRLTSPSPMFPQHYWAYAYIMAIYNAGYTTGYGAGTFAPELNVTREQMAAFIIRAADGEPATDYCSTGSPFPDCSY